MKAIGADLTAAVGVARPADLSETGAPSIKSRALMLLVEYRF